MGQNSFLKARRMWPELIGKYLPRHRRDLQEEMVHGSLDNLFYQCAKLDLFKMKSINLIEMHKLKKRLWLLVMHRHTHLWDKVN